MHSIETFTTEFETELNNIFTYWSSEAIDPATGHFYGSINHYGIKDATANKGIIMYTRQLWAFSAAAKHYKSEKYTVIATRCFNFLKNHFHDTENGGYYWETDCNGTVVDDKKQTYAQAFALYALTEYYKLTESPEAFVYAKMQFDCIMKRCFDEETGGFLEGFTRNWTFDKGNRLSAKDAFAEKSMNTNLHILEALASYYAEFGGAQAQDALKRVVLDFCQYIVGNDGHLVLFMDENWKAQSTIHSYGHDIEASWLLWEAGIILNDSALLKHLRVIVLRMANAFIQTGIAPDGSVLNEKDFATGHIDANRYWWPQCEGLEGLANAFSITQDEKYLLQLIGIWDYIKNHILDRENGEWFTCIDASGKPNTNEDKGGMWKTPYHNGRALLRLIERFKVATPERSIATHH